MTAPLWPVFQKKEDQRVHSLRLEREINPGPRYANEQFQPQLPSCHTGIPPPNLISSHLSSLISHHAHHISTVSRNLNRIYRPIVWNLTAFSVSLHPYSIQQTAWVVCADRGPTDRSITEMLRCTPFAYSAHWWKRKHNCCTTFWSDQQHLNDRS